MLVPACIGLCCGPTFGILFLAQASASCYPSVASATGVALSLSVGRLGALAAPIVFSLVTSATNHWELFFMFMAMAELGCILIFPLLATRPVEAAEVARLRTSEDLAI